MAAHTAPLRIEEAPFHPGLPVDLMMQIRPAAPPFLGRARFRQFILLLALLPALMAAAMPAWAEAAKPRRSRRAPSAASGAPTTLEGWRKSVERAEERYHEEWSVIVRDLDSGEIIFSHKPDERLIPASNRKIVTFALALDKLGPEFRFSTELGLTAPVEPGNAALNGSAILRSNGDPTMTDRFLSQRNPASVIEGWIGSLKALGIRRIQGDFLIDASAFGADQDEYPEAWDRSHRNYSYASPPSAIALNRNLVRVTARPSDTSGRPARIRLYPSEGDFEIDNGTSSASGAQQGLDGRFTEDGKFLVVTGRVGEEIREHVLAIPVARPLGLVRQVVRDALASEGIEVAGEIRIVKDPKEGAGLAFAALAGSHESIPLVELLRIMMRDSDNFLAEQIWRATAFRALGRGDIASARELEQDWYDSKEIPWIEPGYDGCGLSRKTRVAASELAAILAAVNASPYAPYLLDALPSSGRSGTLRGRSMGADIGRILAKTGTLSGASSLSGFILDRKKRPRWVFSLIANAPEETNGRLTTRQNQIMTILVDLLDSGRGAPSGPPPSQASEPGPSTSNGQRGGGEGDSGVKRRAPGTKEYVGKNS